MNYIRAVNNFIVTIILIPVYVTVIGLAFIIHWFTEKKSGKPESYWKKESITNDFTSQY